MLCTYLNLNPNIAKRLAGVIYSAPFFGIPDFVEMTWAKKQVLFFLAEHLKEFAVTSGMPMQCITRNKTYLREIIHGTKAIGLASLGLHASFARSIDSLQAKAREVTYPYFLFLGDKDTIVNNRMTMVWHGKTQSKIKGIRRLPGAFHELSKEPNNDKLFESSLKFMGERLIGKAPGAKATPFGTFAHGLVKY